MAPTTTLKECLDGYQKFEIKKNYFDCIKCNTGDSPFKITSVIKYKLNGNFYPGKEIDTRMVCMAPIPDFPPHGSLWSGGLGYLACPDSPNNFWTYTEVENYGYCFNYYPTGALAARMVALEKKSYFYKPLDSFILSSPPPPTTPAPTTSNFFEKNGKYVGSGTYVGSDNNERRRNDSYENTDKTIYVEWPVTPAPTKPVPTTPVPTINPLYPPKPICNVLPGNYNPTFDKNPSSNGFNKLYLRFFSTDKNSKFTFILNDIPITDVTYITEPKLDYNGNYAFLAFFTTIPNGTTCSLIINATNSANYTTSSDILKFITKTTNIIAEDFDMDDENCAITFKWSGGIGAQHYKFFHRVLRLGGNPENGGTSDIKPNPGDININFNSLTPSSSIGGIQTVKFIGSPITHDPNYHIKSDHRLYVIAYNDWDIHWDLGNFVVYAFSDVLNTSARCEFNYSVKQNYKTSNCRLSKKPSDETY